MAAQFIKSRSEFGQHVDFACRRIFLYADPVTNPRHSRRKCDNVL